MVSHLRVAQEFVILKQPTTLGGRRGHNEEALGGTTRGCAEIGRMVVCSPCREHLPFSDGMRRWIGRGGSPSRLMLVIFPHLGLPEGLTAGAAYGRKPIPGASEGL